MTAGVIIGAARSGAGKTSVTIGLLRALRDRGLAVAGAKSGPDYIDPGFHAAASGAPGVNLDSWAMPPAVLDHALDGSRCGRDMVIVESAMGLFDGIDAPAGRSGAAADLARRYGLPVVLVLDISGQSRSAAAIAHGFASFDPAVTVAGVILNQVASDRHYDQAAAAIRARGIAVLGGIRRNADMALPERHLGLVQAGEHADLENFIARLAATIGQWVDLDAVVAAARPLAMPPAAAAGADMIAPPGQRIALAQDRAFSFVYPH
ncbi:MAG: cobyrinate a,c-diamide synthase, partial [Thalassobaculaceae bacterium]